MRAGRVREQTLKDYMNRLSRGEPRPCFNLEHVRVTSTPPPPQCFIAAPAGSHVRYLPEVARKAFELHRSPLIPTEEQKFVTLCNATPVPGRQEPEAREGKMGTTNSSKVPLWAAVLRTNCSLCKVVALARGGCDRADDSHREKYQTVLMSSLTVFTSSPRFAHNGLERFLALRLRWPTAYAPRQTS